MKMFTRNPATCLESHIIFHGLSPEDLGLMVPHLEFETFEKGDTIIEESSEGNALYVIAQGKVEVVKNFKNGADGAVGVSRLAELGHGDSFGEMELLDTMKRSDSVIAMKKTTCLVLTTGTFVKLYELRPETYRIITLNLARELSRRLRAADHHIAEMDDHLERCKKELAELRYGGKGPKPVQVVWS